MATAFSDHNTMMACLSNLCSLEPEDLLLNDLLDDKPGSPPYFCGCCDERAPASSHCRDCNELLCDKCVSAHIRVKLTKTHSIVTLDDSPTCSSLMPGVIQKPNNGSPTKSILNGNSHCDLHVSEIVHLYCDSCFATICGECIVKEHRGHSFSYLKDAIEKAETAAVKLLSDGGVVTQACEESIDLIQRAIESLNVRSHTVAREVRNVIRKCMLALEERESELLGKLEKLRLMKQKHLLQQLENLRNALANYALNSKLLTEALDVGNTVDIFKAKDNTYLSWKKLLNLKSTLPSLDDEFTFTPPDPSFILAIAKLGDITSNCSPAVSHESLLRSLNVRTGFNVVSKSPGNEDVPCLSDPLSPFLTCPENRSLGSDNEENKVALTLARSFSYFRPIQDISQPQQILTRKQPCSLGPIGSSRSSRDYRDCGRPQLVFGIEGEKDGQLCRPWGVCCDPEGNIIVADRSNNRIQIFKSNGAFLHKFGSYGSEQGQFDRPAGVATDSHGRIAVTDKDNHRVQVFTSQGQFLFMFGEKGSKIGQFNYPWDIAIDGKGRIVVSDTRNHRIQLFSPDGIFLQKYGFENSTNMWKHFDSPRGVSFGTKGCVIVTDFNNHRLVVIDHNFRNARFLGSEGSGVKQFLRPQGVAVDNDGNIIVADSRNSRIQIFEPNGSFLWQFGLPGKEHGQLDRPSGVCLTPNGKIVVVDFGNHRIQIF